MENKKFIDLTAEKFDGKFGNDHLQYDLKVGEMYILKTNLGYNGATHNTKVKILYINKDKGGDIIIAVVYGDRDQYLGIQDFYYNGSEKRYKILTYYSDPIDWRLNINPDLEPPKWFYDVCRRDLSKLLVKHNTFGIIHELNGTFTIDKYNGYAHHIQLTELSSVDLVVLRDKLDKAINDLNV